MSSWPYPIRKSIIYIHGPILMSFPYSEFSRLVDLSQEEFNVPKVVEATAKECHDLAQRFQLSSLQHIRGSYTNIEKDAFDVYTVIIQFHAALKTQEDPDDVKEIHEEILCRFYPDNKPVRQEDEEDINVDVDFHDEGKIDVGEIMAQYIYLSMNV